MTHVDIESGRKALETFDAINKKVRNRITEIVKLICKESGNRYRDWAYCECDDCRGMDYGESCEYSDARSQIYDGSSDYIKLWISYISNPLAKVYQDQIPRSFLFMSDDEIRGAVSRTMRKQGEELKSKDKKRIMKQQEDKELAEAAREKLTAAEKKVLGL